MKKGFVLSIVLHATMILFFTGLSFVFPKEPIPQSKVVLDVELAVLTKNIAKKIQVKKTKRVVTKKSKPKAKPKPKKKIKPKKVIRKKIKPKKKVVLKPKKKVSPKTVKKKALKPVKKISKPSPKKATKVVETKKVLKTLTPKKKVITDSKAKKNTTIKKTKPKSIVNDTKKDSPNKSKTKIQDGRLDSDDLIAFRNQIKECWNIPAGVQDARNLVTKINVIANQNGTVDDAKIYWTSKSLNNPFMKVMSESAMRAILSEQCSPLKLPKKKYEQWKKIIITFDPKDML